MENKRYYFATWLRAAATVSILLCHFTAQSTNRYLNMLGQFFNIGVQLFIILSGFLYGVHRGGGDYKTWYISRIKRIYVPYELFVITLLIVHIIKRIPLNLNWVWLALGFQGSVVGVLGAEQTWFITPLLMCYAITPALDRFLSKEMSKWRAVFTVAVAVMVKMLWVIPESAAFDTLLSLVSWYVVGFVIGRCFDRIELNNRRAGMALFLMCTAFTIRIVGRFLCDGSVLYDRVICGYTHAVAAVCIFYLFAVAFQDIRPNRPVQYLGTISFEVYLVHYMFCVGPLRLFGVTPIWGINCLIVIAVSFILAFGIHSIVEIIIKRVG